MKHIAIASGLLLAFSLPATAQQRQANPEELFKRLDANGDGKVAADEVGEDQGRFFDRLVRVGDKDDNGELSREEFLAALQRPERPAGGDRRPEGGFRPGAFFERLDQNGDGKLTLGELPEELRERLKPIFDRADKDELTREDFARFSPQPGGFQPPNPGEMFRRLDQNGDGKLALGELPEFLRERFRGAYERLEKDALTQEEFSQIAQRLGPRRPDADPNRPPQGDGFRGPVFFAKLDENSDGRLTKEELAKAADKFAELDTNGDGAIDPRELFGPGPGDRGPAGRPGARPDSDRGPRSGEFAERIFRQMDRNGDGKISKEEAPDRLREGFDRLDANGDGSIDLEEFRQRTGRRPDGAAPDGARRPRRPQNEN